MLKILLGAVFAVCFYGTAQACGSNEYEWCWDVGFAKDCKCLPKVDAGPISDTTEALKPHVAQLASELRKTPEAMQECMQDVQRCAMEIVSAPLAAPIQAYLDDLYKQSAGRSYSFSPEFVALAQPYFEVNISALTFANDINTRNGYNVSYCDRIFFTGHGNLWISERELNLVLHEIEHTVQCQKRGKPTYLAEYVLKAGIDVLRRGTFDIHDVHDYEVAANNKASYLTPILWQKIKSGAVRIPNSANPANQLPVANKFPPGHVLQNCGCWGPTNSIVPTPLCISGSARPQICAGMCVAGGSPYGFVCN